MSQAKKSHESKEQEQVPTKLQFSKKLSIVDTIAWITITLLIIVILFFGDEAIYQYCISLEGSITAAYVSLRLGYTGKAALENYKKIGSTLKELENPSNKTIKSSSSASKTGVG